MADLVIEAIAAVGVASATLVNVELTDGRGDPIVGYVSGSDNVIVLPTTVITDDNGEVIIDLIPNSDIVPGNSCYTVRIAHKQFLIQKSGISQSLFEALVNDPGDLDPINTDFLLRANNLSDLEDVSMARDNLGLGDSATLDVGTIAGTVAAGDDSRFEIAPDHIADTVDAHDATAISFNPTVSIPADDVQEAIEYVWDNAGGGGGTNDHNALINRGAADQHPASSVTNTPAGTIAATTVQAAINELDGDIQDHINDTVDAHDASAISLVPFATISATDVQNGLQQVYAAAVAGLDEASEISFVPTGDIVATNVQAAIVEVDGELHAHEALATDAHDASAISFAPASGITSTNVQAAIVESLTDSIAYTDGVVASYVLKDGSYSPGTVDVLKARITSDANPRFTLNADGSMEWSDGTAAIDTNLYRSTTDALKTDDSFQAVRSGFGTAPTATARITLPTGSTPAEGIIFGTDANLYRNSTSTIATDGSMAVNARLGVGTNPSPSFRILLASGTAANSGIGFGADTNLYRSAADTLKTDDALHVALNVGVGTAPAANRILTFAGSPGTGADVYGILGTPAGAATATTSITAGYFRADTAAASFTTTQVQGLYVENSIAGAGSTITNAYGITGAAQTAATNNYTARFAASSTQCLWLDFAANNTTANAGIAFGASRDTNLYRSAANTLKTDDKFVTVAGLGVGNSAAATTPGSVVKKIEVFDASGASLGFIPVYSTIT